MFHNNGTKIYWLGDYDTSERTNKFQNKMGSGSACVPTEVVLTYIVLYSIEKSSMFFSFGEI